MPASGEAVLNIDRRKISIETKRALERIPGLEFRQGFVTDLRLVAGGDDRQRARVAETAVPRPSAERSTEPTRTDQRVEVETIFGEILEADAVVVAVGTELWRRASIPVPILCTEAGTGSRLPKGCALRSKRWARSFEKRLWR